MIRTYKCSIRGAEAQGCVLPQVAHMLAEHAYVTASDGARIPVDGCEYVLDMLCHSSNVSVCLFPIDSLEIQVQRCGGCHVWQRPLQTC